jgi:hypothetical protein
VSFGTKDGIFKSFRLVNPPKANMHRSYPKNKINSYTAFVLSQDFQLLQGEG